MDTKKVVLIGTGFVGMSEEDQAKFNESCQISKENIENQIVPILRKK